MKTWIQHLPLFAAALLAASLPAHAGFTLKEMSPQSKACAECHKKESAALYEQWGASKHYRGNVGCYECHMALTNDIDGFEHYGQTISTIVTPKDCGRCHEAEVGEFNSSHHAKAGRILGSLDNVLAEIVEGNHGFKTPMFTNGDSSAAVNGCWQCHGAEVKMHAERQTRPRHLAQHRHRPHQSRRQRRLLCRMPFAPRILRRPGAHARYLRQMSHGPGPSAD